MRIDFSYFSDFFQLYTQSYIDASPSLRRNLQLKTAHSWHVLAQIKTISRLEQLDKESCYLAEIIGLFHDIGRFEQYTRYQTFSDTNSVDHGCLGVSIIQQEKVLKDLPERSQELILDGIRYHNKKDLPTHVSPTSLQLIKLIRDADKLDIYRIVTRHYLSGTPNTKLTLDLDESRRYNPVCIERIKQHQLIDKQELSTVTDFKLLQISWVFELHHRASYQLLSEKQYIEKIFSTLPNDASIRSIQDSVYKHLREQASLMPANYESGQ